MALLLIVHSKLDYCNFLYYNLHNLHKSQINRLQQIQNCLARNMVKATESSHVTHSQISALAQDYERIEYLVSLTYKVLTSYNQPT